MVGQLGVGDVQAGEHAVAGLDGFKDLFFELVFLLQHLEELIGLEFFALGEEVCLFIITRYTIPIPPIINSRSYPRIL